MPELLVDQMDATSAPTTANVTIAAPGTGATDKSKCFRAKMYAKVGDFDSVSTTRVRLVRSPTPSAPVKNAASAPPRHA
eukprot:CAMPEP_0201272318 /NCGR_PEP_ID=MMETSP0853-20130426/41183_1 /ASSEMBLY_ACC=CAM_ASM_000640 /TAXON_ID=183588 /ORGANISM="Pseudo-nitzschia fraudulenta, Strain WWA7" /LENGTH=78 /DNA_ID=CAMNT_0047579177 /DNA_START=84 /DNA_END=317 /DNA_ORIENTATION=+